MLAHAKWLLGALLVTLSLFASSTFGTWMLTCGMMLLAVVIVALRGRSATTVDGGWVMPRWLKMLLVSLSVIIIAAVTAAWRFGSQLGESINPIYVGIDVLAHTAVFISLFAWTMRPLRGHVSMLPLGLLVMLLCVAAGGTSQTLAAQTTVALAACMGFVLASQIILSSAIVNENSLVAFQRDDRQRSRRVASLFSLLTLSLILMATSAIAKATSEVLPGVQDNLHEQLNSTFEAINQESFIGGTRYVRGSKLGSIRKHMLGDPTEIALHVYAERSPGYLRGSVFDTYRRYRWFEASNFNLPPERRTQSISDRSVSSSGKGSVPLESVGKFNLERFPLSPKSGSQFATLEIRNDPLKGPVVFTPLAASWLEANSGEVVVSHHGIVRIGVDVTYPYVAGVGVDMPKEMLVADRREFLLESPQDVDAVARRITSQVCEPNSTARSKATAISTYFRKEFSYAMNVTKPPAGTDPMVHFLESKHPAHCEYFASATVLLLRSVDVPARYVTGYVSSEYSEEELCWLARNRDAHAWVEAYDDVEQTWFPVESTPGRTYHSINPLGDDTNSDDAGATTGNSWGDDSDSFLGRIWGWLTSFRATDPLMVVFRIAQLPLFFVLVFLLWTKFWRSGGGSIDPIDAQSRRMLRQVDRLSRRYQLIRQSHETLHQFAERIERRHHDQAIKSAKQAKEQGRLAELANWYRQYGEARYRGVLPIAFAK